MSVKLSQRKVLVLNKSWTPIKIVTIEKAMKKLFSTYKDGTPKARIIDCVHDFQTMTWEDWTSFCTKCGELRTEREIVIVTDANGHKCKTCSKCKSKLGEPSTHYCTECRVERKQPEEIAEGHKCSKCSTKLGEAGMRSVNAIFRIPTIILEGRFDKLPQQKVHYNRRTIYRRDNNTCQYCGKKKAGSELSLDHVIPRCQGGLTTWENIVVACTDCNAKKAGRTPREANMKLLRQPKKPNYNFFPGDIRIRDWEHFLGEAYWLTELVHDGE